MSSIRLGTRKSPLALAQAEAVRDALLAAGAEAVEIVSMTTSGDENKQDAIAQWGFKGLFTKEIEEGLLAGSLDIAVHSMKDMPSELPDGLMLAAMQERGDPRDALISPHASTLDELLENATIGTASTRRAAQLKAIRPDLRCTEFRGSVETRLRKLAEGTVDATLLAVAGLTRLGMDEHITQILPLEQMLPAIGQGAIGIECRSDDAETRALLAKINHAESFACVSAERVVLTALDGSCKTPIAAYAHMHGDQMHLRAEVLALDGTKRITAEATGSADEVGKQVSEMLLEQGAKELIANG